MPRRKKSTGPPRKAQLSFLERPLEGPKHSGGSPRPCPAPPRLVPLRPADRETRPAWVSPQFKKPLGSWLPVGRRRPPPPPCRRLPFQLGGAARRRRSLRRARSAWFPPLTFKDLLPAPGATSSTAAAQHEAPGLEGQEERPEKAGGPPTLPSSPSRSAPRQPDPAAPETPGLALAVGDTAHAVRAPSRGRCPLRLEGPQTPPPAGRPPLVVDTPEEKYGLKVTWRRRIHLASYLRAIGKLNVNQIFVSTLEEAANPRRESLLPAPPGPPAVETSNLKRAVRA